VTYTQAAVLGVLATGALDLVLLRTRVLARKAFWVSYAIVLAFQLLTNGVLTGQGVVRYDDEAILGARVANAPVEDLLFGFALVVQTTSWWAFWGRRLSAAPSAGRVRPPAVDGPG
jgi:lycopene cyclase domain-containing protein